MTGFGTAARRVEGGELRVEAASVNGRGLSVKARLPEALAAFHPEVERLARERLARGTLTVTAEIRQARGRRRAVLNEDALAGYLKDFAAARRRHPALPEPDWRTLTALPGVLEGPREDPGLAKAMAAALAGALDACVKDRAREGKALATILLGILARAEKALATAEARREAAREAYRGRLEERLAKALGSATPLDPDLRRDILVQAERADIAEEVARLKVHVTEARRCLAAKEPMGRRLDFLAQEMLREANTLGSKSQDAPLTLAALDLKTALDQFKEQVQNVE